MFLTETGLAKVFQRVRSFVASQLNSKASVIHTHTSSDITDLYNLIYPIGSIYLSVNSVDPSTLFGGTWEKIKDKFLLSDGDTYIIIVLVQTLKAIILMMCGQTLKATTIMVYMVDLGPGVRLMQQNRYRHLQYLDIGETTH